MRDEVYQKFDAPGGVVLDAGSTQTEHGQAREELLIYKDEFGEVHVDSHTFVNIDRGIEVVVDLDTQDHSRKSNSEWREQRRYRLPNFRALSIFRENARIERNI